jgi:hypothetical protein
VEDKEEQEQEEHEHEQEQEDYLTVLSQAMFLRMSITRYVTGEAEEEEEEEEEEREAGTRMEKERAEPSQLAVGASQHPTIPPGATERERILLQRTHSTAVSRRECVFKIRCTGCK